MPNGLPLGVLVYGLVLGSLTSLSAMGIVLIYRASRVINFAQAEIGGLSASVATVMVAGWHLPYVLAVIVGLATALATGWLIDAVVVRRFFNAPRLIFMVATVGLAQLLGGLELLVPKLFTHLASLSTFSTPFSFHFRIGPLAFDGNSLVAVVAVPVLLGALYWFLGRSDTGIAIRAAADSQERALLLGIPVRKLSRVTWVLAAGLSGVAALLAAPIVGPDLGSVAGPEALLVPLTAAVVARMESLPVTVMAGLGVSVLQQAIFWSYPRSTTVDICLFAIVVLSLLMQRRRFSRVDDGGLGGYIAVREVRPVSPLLRRLPEIRAARWAGSLVVLAVVVLLPATFADSTLDLWAFFAIYGVLAVSLVVLTGWAGQISLGQFAFAGAAAGTTAALLVSAHADLFFSLAASVGIGAMTAALIGIPALRITGPFLAVTTLAFGVPVSTYLLNSANFPALTPSLIPRPVLWNRIDLNSRLTFYYFCLLCLAASLILARNYRRSRAGRTIIAVRDNERAAAAYSVDPVRSKLSAFAFSGALAGLAGGLYAVALKGIPFSGFAPVDSLVIFTMVVIGGVGSLPGAVLGAIYVEGVQDYLQGAGRLLATGGGLLILLMIVPGGLGEIIFSLRDRVLAYVARRRSLSVPSLAERPDDLWADLKTEPAPQAETGPADHLMSGGAGGEPVRLLECRDVHASYGQVQVLFGVDLWVQEGEVAALLGTNGAGKSTVLRVVAGLLGSAPGEVRFAGQDISGLSPVERVRAGIVTVPGGRGVFGSLTVAENLRLGGWLARRDRQFVDRTMEWILELFPVLGTRSNQQASLLSGGEQQMLTIAQALLCRPKLLMIDELSLGLAPAVVATLLGVVRQLNDSGITVLVVEQSVNVATSLAHRAVFMEKGQVRFSGETADLADRPDLLRSVFLRGATGAAPVPDRPERSTGVPAPSAALEVRALRRSFGGVTAVDGVGFSLGEGEILGIIGSNGAGKTTLVDLISGFVSADEGSVHLEGEDVTALSAAGRSALGLGRLFQDARLFPSLTVAETIATAMERHVEVRDPLALMFRLKAGVDSERRVSIRVDELIETMGLGRYRDAFISELSTGTRRIVDLACALAHDPSVLLLDEPSSGIAQRETEALGEVLLRVRQLTGASMVMIEHDMPLVSSVSDRIICMHLGAVIAEGQPAAVLSDPAVVASYLGQDEVTISRSGPIRPLSRRLSVAEYARHGGVTPETVRRQIRAGSLAAVRGPRGYLIEVEDPVLQPSYEQGRSA
ncbi:MAG: ATP-binding cassette domain-containing protein [Acidimicrobiales bacterium]